MASASMDSCPVRSDPFKELNHVLNPLTDLDCGLINDKCLFAACTDHAVQMSNMHIRCAFAKGPAC